jgi:class 3 adenylate cyclase
LDTVRYVSSATLSPQTFLFMDLVGFTALTAERGDGDAADVALRFYRRVRALLARHDAEEIKTIGDAMMLRCEDPRTGVELGVRLSEDICGSPDLPPVRVGVHTGSAVPREGDWYGNAVNVAARLCSVAGGGEVLISEEVRSAAGRLDGLDLTDRRLHWLKNVPEPVVTWSASSVEPAALSGTARGRLVAFLRRHNPARCAEHRAVTA